jgi:hypothetical protein
MKRFITLIVILLSINGYGQSGFIKHSLDKMDGSENYTFSKQLKVMSGSTKWFIIEPILQKNDSNKIVCSGLYIKFKGIGACNDNDVMDFLFTDGQKLKIKAWNQFACDNTSAFFIDKSNTLGDCLISIVLLNKSIKSIRFMNGRSFENLTADIIDKNYFLDLNSVLEKQIIKN